MMHFRQPGLSAMILATTRQLRPVSGRFGPYGCLGGQCDALGRERGVTVAELSLCLIRKEAIGCVSVVVSMEGGNGLFEGYLGFG
jgi:hypothetical protein